jgi:hypothetical protein
VTPNARLNTREKCAASQKPQRLGAHEPGHRLVDVLEQSVQRPHRHRIGAGDRGRPDRGILEVTSYVATDLGAHRLARGGAAGRHGRLDRRPQQLERRVGRGHAGRRFEPGLLEGQRVHVANEQAGRTAPVQRRERAQLRQPRANGQHPLAGEDQRALVKRLDDLHVGGLVAVPHHHVAGGQGKAAGALAHRLDPPADELEAQDVLLPGFRAHHRAATMAEEW